MTECSVYNWENGVSSPDFRKLPAIIAFLGYNPVPEPTGAAERLVWERRARGLSQKEAAGRLGVDLGTLAKRERGRSQAGKRWHASQLN